jgi:hypothetical protein
MAKNKNHCDVGLDQRCRDNDGEIRQKRGDTLIKNLRKTYGEDFAPGIRGDARRRRLPMLTSPISQPKPSTSTATMRRISVSRWADSGRSSTNMRLTIRTTV